MIHILKRVGLVFLFPGFCPAQSLSPPEALERYLARSRDRQPECSGLVFEVQIDASLPKLKKHGGMRGLKLVSSTGQVVYRGLRFTGDSLIKTAVIARFLSQDTDQTGRTVDTAVIRRNYSFTYQKTSDYNGAAAYVFRLKPTQKRAGLFKGALWLDADTAAPLRLSGDFIKSPSIFVRCFHFIQDYQNLNECFEPVRLSLTIETRIAGEADMTMRLNSINGQPATAGSGGPDSPSVSGRALGH